MVGFLDDNPRVRRRRILGITVVGSTDEVERAVASTRAEEVLVTIPTPRPSGSKPSCVRRRPPGSPAGSSAGGRSSRPPSRSRPRSRELHAGRRGAGAPRPLRPLPGGDSTPHRLLRARRAYVAGVAPPGADDLHRRARADPALARDRRDRRAGTAREPYGLATLVAYFLAPVWWLASTSTAYAAAKLLLVLAMTATVFPAYALARLVVSRWYALAAAAGATAVPALAYSTIIVEEPLAYPMSTLTLWLIARSLVDPRWMRVAVAALACAAAAWRTQLATLRCSCSALLGSAGVAASGAGARSGRPGTGPGDASSSASRSPSARSSATTRRAGGTRPASTRTASSTTGCGRWARSRSASGSSRWSSGSPRSRARRASLGIRRRVPSSSRASPRSPSSSPTPGSRAPTSPRPRDARRRAERHLPRPCPVRGRGAGRGAWRRAQLGNRRGDRLHALRRRVDALHLENYPYYEAHGLSIAAFANRELEWPESRIENGLLVVCGLALAFVVALRSSAGSGAYRVLAGTAAVFVLAMDAHPLRGLRRRGRARPRPASHATSPPLRLGRGGDGRGSVVVVGQQVGDPATSG